MIIRFLIVLVVFLSTTAWAETETASRKITITPCPKFFLVIPWEIYSALHRNLTDQVDAGVYFMTTGKQYPPPFYLPKTTIARIANVYPCGIIIAVVSDNALFYEGDIREWIVNECKRKPIGECYRPKFSESKLATILPTDTDNGNDTIMQSTYSPTIRSFAPDKCEDRADLVTCLQRRPQHTDCHWFDVDMGCHPVDYCEVLTTRTLCGTRKMYCLWKNLQCVSRSVASKGGGVGQAG